MATTATRVVGIDLGTTKSCVALYDGERVRVLKNSEGCTTTPSVVAYDISGSVLVGDAAKRQAVVNPQSTIYGIKRLVGLSFAQDTVRIYRELCPYAIVAGSEGEAWVEANGTKLAPPQVIAEILKKLKRTAEDFAGKEVREVVLTCPALFNTKQRQDLQDAALLAGLEVRRIVCESTAAALAYGEEQVVSAAANVGAGAGVGTGAGAGAAKGTANGGLTEGESKIVVFDFGGGGVNVSVLDLSIIDGEKTYEVLAVNGDSSVGGSDFDNRLVSHIVACYKQQRGIDLRRDKRAKQRLLEASEKAKIELSYLQQTDVTLPYITADKTGPKHLNITITRSKFESIVSDLVKKAMGVVHTALSEAHVVPQDIDEVVLVGGQAQMPLVQKALTDFFGKAPKQSVSSEEAVATGAALYAAAIAGQRDDIMLLDATSLPIGIELNDGDVVPVFARNTTIPAQKTYVIPTMEDNQTALLLHVVQGTGTQAKSADNVSLGHFLIDGIKPAPKGSTQIAVAFDLDQQGQLSLSAKVVASGTELSVSRQSKIDEISTAPTPLGMVTPAQAKTATATAAAAAAASASAHAQTAANVSHVEKSAEDFVAALSLVPDEARTQISEYIATEIKTVRNRAARDIERERKFALERYVKALLPIYDSLEKALELSDRNNEATKATIDGVEQTLALFLKELTSFGVTCDDPTGKLFDPNFHQAVSLVSTTDVPNNHVLNTMRKGFILNGRVVRPAMVIVGRAPQQ